MWDIFTVLPAMGLPTRQAIPAKKITRPKESFTFSAPNSVPRRTGWITELQAI